MSAYDIVVVGELNVDLVLRGDVAPTFGQVEKWIESATLTIGSSSAIFACGAARLGLRVAFLGKVGQDEFGQFLMRALAAHGIALEGVVTAPALKTGLSVILSRRDGDRAILTYAGSIPALRYDELDWAVIARARHLHLGSFFLLDALRPDVPQLFAGARERGLTVSLDTNYDPSEQWKDYVDETMAQVDLFLPNETELRGITGMDSAEEGLTRLAARVPTVAVKLGARGAMAQCGAERVLAPSFAVEVVDTTGAGDSFDAGFVYGQLAGWDLARSLRLGVVCGALSTRAAGGTGAQPTLKEAEAYL
jgi:sugar/nucleoside kinase (ribokinase family)